MKIKYGDRLSILVTRQLETDIAQTLGEWVMELSEAEEIDLDHAQLEGMKRIIRLLAEESDKLSKISANSTTDDTPF